MNAPGQGRKPKLKADPNALRRAPPPPKHLDTFAKEEWRRIMPYLIDQQIVTKVDLTGVETYCDMISTIRKTRLLMQRALKDAAQSEDGDSAEYQRLFGVVNRASVTARQLAAEYGLTPVSRMKLGELTKEDDDADNPLAVR